MKSFNFKNLYIFNLIELNASQESVTTIYNFLNINDNFDLFLSSIPKEYANILKQKISMIGKEVSTYSVFALSFETKKKIFIFNSVKKLESLVDNYHSFRIDKIVNEEEFLELTDFLTDYLEFKYGLITRSIEFFRNSDKPILIINLLHYLNTIKIIDLNLTKNICDRLLHQNVIKKIPEGLVLNTKIDEFYGKDYINDTLKGTDYYLVSGKKNNFKIDNNVYKKYRDILSKNNLNFQVSDFNISLKYSSINDVVKIYRYIKIEESLESSLNYSNIDETIKILLENNKNSLEVNKKISERKAQVYRLLNQEIKPYFLAYDSYVIDLKLIVEIISIFNREAIPYFDIQDLYFALSTSSDFIKLSNCFVFDKNYKVSFNLYNFIYNKLSDAKFHINIENMYKEYNEKVVSPKISLVIFIDLIKEKYLGNLFKNFVIVDELLLYNLAFENDSFLLRIKSENNITTESMLFNYIKKEFKFNEEQTNYIFNKANLSKTMKNAQLTKFDFQIIHENKIKEYLNIFVEEQSRDYFLSQLRLEKNIYFPKTYVNLSSAVETFFKTLKSPQSIKSLSNFISKKELLNILKPYFKSFDLFLFEKDTLLTGEWNNLSDKASSFLYDFRKILMNESLFTIFSCKNNINIKKILQENEIVSTLGNEFIENLLIYNEDVFSNTINNYRIFSYKEIPRLSNIIKNYIYQKRKTYFLEISSFLETLYGIRYNVTKKDLKEMPFFYISPETENIFFSIEYYRKIIKEQLEND